jgi:hypothetical protein
MMKNATPLHKIQPSRRELKKPCSTQHDACYADWNGLHFSVLPEQQQQQQQQQQHSGTLQQQEPTLHALNLSSWVDFPALENFQETMHESQLLRDLQEDDHSSIPVGSQVDLGASLTDQEVFEGGCLNSEALDDAAALEHMKTLLTTVSEHTVRVLTKKRFDWNSFLSRSAQKLNGSFRSLPLQNSFRYPNRRSSKSLEGNGGESTKSVEGERHGRKSSKTKSREKSKRRTKSSNKDESV